MLVLLAFLSLTLAPLPQERETVVAGSAGEELDAYLEACAFFGFSGCVLVEKDGELLLRKGYGLARPGEGTPNTPETLYDIASASKQVTAAAILLLEAQGKLSTDDSIAEYLPGVPREHREVTIYHLLTHTSGFSRAGSTGAGNDLETALQGYFRAKRAGKAGERFEYYNGGYAMLAGVVERITGESFEDWVRQYLFRPAGLRQTDFIETARVDADLLASSHDSGKLTTNYIKGWGYKGMGGVLTSVSDLALWCHALFDGELLEPEALEKLLTPYRDDYACGWYVFETDKDRKVVQHGGSSPGFQSYIRNFVDDDVLILVMSNRKGWHWQVAWGLSALTLGEDPKAAFPPEVTEWKDAKLDAVCGAWEADGGEHLVIRRSGSGILIAGIGTDVFAALAAPPGRRGGRPRDASSGRPRRRELEAAEERAMAMVAELRGGSCDLLGEDLGPHIHKSWPNRILRRIWPAHVERWGKVRDHRSLGAFYEPSSGRTRVWIRLDQERGERSLEVAFVGSSLHIFDLKARDFPVQVGAVPVDKKRLVGFDLSDDPPYELTLRGKGKSRKLELRVRGGDKLVFKPQ